MVFVNKRISEMVLHTYEDFADITPDDNDIVKYYAWHCTIETSLDGATWTRNAIKAGDTFISYSYTYADFEDRWKEAQLQSIFSLFEICRILGFSKHQFTEAVPPEYRARFRRELALRRENGADKWMGFGD